LKQLSIYFLLLLAVITRLHSQSIPSLTYSAHKIVEIPFGIDTSIIIEGLIVPGSLKCTHPCQDSISYNVRNNRLTIITSHISCPAELKKLIINYRSIPSLSQKFCLIDSNHITKNDKVIPIASDYEKFNSRDNRIIQTNKIKYDGSFARGLSAGNNQDLVLNSSFNMSLSGELKDGLEIKGVISDDNIPIQAQGNTQQLQEFDKVYLEVSKNESYLRAGDYILEKNKPYFLRYFKKLQGASVGHALQKDDLQIDGSLSYAVSRGKFARQILSTQEGNQGPYKLTGNEGERFLIVLSGTERVFADGILLTRGFQYDYIIDYNTAEIEFTINKIIDKDSRIIIEYEYTDQNYLRTLYAGDAAIKNEKWSVEIDLYSEQDSRNVSGFLELDSIQLRRLAESGDDPENLIISGIFSPEDTSGNFVWYEILTDTLTSSPYLSYVAEYQEGAVTSVFSEVAENSGEYIIDQTIGVNDRVYKYVGPNEGKYMSEVRLIPPRQKQIVNLNGHYKIGENIRIGSEFSMSNTVLNRFSDLESDDDFGTALLLYIDQKKLLSKEKNWQIKTGILGEYKQINYVGLNPYRDVEFQRIWSLENSTEKFTELLTNSHITLSNNDWNIKMAHKHFSQFEKYNGNKIINGIIYNTNNWIFDFKNDILFASDLVNDIQFWIPKLRMINKPSSDGWGYGVEFLMEKNEIRDQNTFILDEKSFHFYRTDFFIEKIITQRLESKISYSKRIDQGISNSEFKKATHADEFGLQLIWDVPEKNKLSLKGIYRSLNISNSLLTNNEPKRSLYGRLENKFLIFNKGVKGETLIESSSGQEAKNEFKYLEVQQGEGGYIWNDYNGDNIQQINEFEIAPFGDLGDFEKFTVFNNEFVKTTKNEVVQLLTISLNKMIEPNKKFTKFLSKLSTRSRVKLSEKFEDEGDENLSFAKWSLQDTSLVSYVFNYDHNVFYNLGSSLFDIQIATRSVRNRIVFITGFEEKQQLTHFTRFRWNINNQIDFIIEGELGEKNSLSENFEVKNYQIDYFQFYPQVNWRIGTKFRYSLKYRYESQENNSGEEVTSSNDFGMEATWRNALKSSLNVSINFIKHNYNGNTGTPVELEMLSGLQKGNNFIWQSNYTQRINKQIDATIIYQGRKSETSKTIHTFSGQMKLLF